MAKNNNGKIWRIAAIIVVLFTASIGVAYSYGKYCDRVESLKATAKKADTNENTIIRMDEKLNYLVISVDEIKEELKLKGRGE